MACTCEKCYNNAAEGGAVVAHVFASSLWLRWAPMLDSRCCIPLGFINAQTLWAAPEDLKRF